MHGASFYMYPRSLFATQRKNQRNPFIEFVPSDQAGVNSSHRSARVDEYRRRLDFYSVRAPHAAALVERHWKRNSEHIDEPLNIFCASLLVPSVDSDNVKTRLCVPGLHSIELRKFVTTRRTPRAPERNDDSMAPHLRQLDPTTVERWKIDVRSAFARARRLRLDV